MNKRNAFKAAQSLRPVALAVVALMGAGGAQAFQIASDSDWNINWDNTIQYNLGVRAREIDPMIGNNPAFAESEYKFAKKGDVVTNRFAILSEFDAVYQKRMGVRISASGWKDFAYNNRAETNPGTLADFSPFGGPTMPYTSNYDNGEYSSRTKRFYKQGAQLLDAFVFANFDLGDRPSSIRLGRLTQFWGNSLFFGPLGIAYSQSATDLMKAAAAPGTQQKELALPRGQINFSTQLTDTLQFGSQYFMEWAGNRLPEGGTYMGPVDFGFGGPDQFGPAHIRRASPDEPNGRAANYGVQLRWSPAWLEGTLGAYFRRFDETQPWNPIFGGFTQTGPSIYRLGYARGTKTFGLSLDKQFGGFSLGAEVSFRKKTGLNTDGFVFIPSDSASANHGARGDTLNILVNGLKVLESTPLYDTGSLVFEFGFVRKVGTTKDGYESRYKACAPGATKYSGCSTDNAFVFGTMFEPQWLQVAPSLDLSMPLFVMYGVKGNGASSGLPVLQGDTSYSAGLKFNYQQTYNLTVQYNGTYGRHVGYSNFGAPMGVPNGTPGFPLYYATGNNVYQFNDRNWVSLTFSTTF